MPFALYLRILIEDLKVYDTFCVNIIYICKIYIYIKDIYIYIYLCNVYHKTVYVENLYIYILYIIFFTFFI